MCRNVIRIFTKPKKKNVWNCYTSELILVKDTSLSADADVSTTA